MYAETAIALLLPELEQGLFDDLWRIRSDLKTCKHNRCERNAAFFWRGKVDSVSLLFSRFSSVQLLGDLLFHISGVTGKMTTETASEDDNFGTAASNKV